jgi:hypothetical protein
MVASTVKRAVKNAFTSNDTIIKQFKTQFDDLGKSFHDEATRQIQLMVVRMQDVVKDSGWFPHLLLNLLSLT